MTATTAGLAGLAETLTGEDWQRRALCRQVDPELWFPDKGRPTQEAKRICLECDVRAQCLEYALRRDERYGVWGGLSERERKRKRQRATRDAAGLTTLTTREACRAAGVEVDPSDAIPVLRSLGFTPISARSGVAKRWDATTIGSAPSCRDCGRCFIPGADRPAPFCSHICLIGYHQRYGLPVPHRPAGELWPTELAAQYHQIPRGPTVVRRLLALRVGAARLNPVDRETGGRKRLLWDSQQVMKARAA